MKIRGYIILGVCTFSSVCVYLYMYRQLDTSHTHSSAVHVDKSMLGPDDHILITSLDKDISHFMDNGYSVSKCPYTVETFEEEVLRQFDYIIEREPQFALKYSSRSFRRNEISKSNFTRSMDQLQAKADSTAYHVETRGRCDWNNFSFLHIMIHEEYLDKASTGGSGYFVTIQGVYLNVCPVRDHFNGSYSALCPLYQSCSNVSIMLKHMDFSAFNGRTKVLEKIIWTKDNICIDGNLTVDTFSDAQLHSKNGSVASDRLSDSHSKDAEMKRMLMQYPFPNTAATGEAGHWFQYNNTWRWLGNNGLLLPVTNPPKQCQCFRRFSKVILMGDSHPMRSANCVNNACKQYGTKIKRIPANYMDRISIALGNLFRSLQNGTEGPYLIGIQFGVWDIVEYYWDVVLQKSIQQFRKVLKDLYVDQRHNFPNVTVLVMSPPSGPDQDHKQSRVAKWHNWILGAYSAALRRHMRGLDGVMFVDEYRFTLPLYWYVHTWPGQWTDHHYSSDGDCAGHVGLAFNSLMTSALCPDMPLN